MPDDPLPLPVLRKPTAQRPLLGVTVLAVEDSRFASEALRLLCLRSGARLRRADTVASARRHLSLYRPTVMIIDDGLPDGSGTELLAELHAAEPRVPVLIGWSGDPMAEAGLRAAGAQAYFEKPLADLAAFQQAILENLPEEMQPQGLRAVTQDTVEPDQLALRDDLTAIAPALEAGDDAQLAYAAQFLTSVARSASDGDLGAAGRNLAASLGAAAADAAPKARALAQAADLVSDRLRQASPL